MCIRSSVRTPASWSALGLFFVLCRWPSWPVRRALRVLSLISQGLRVARHPKGGAGLHVRVLKSAFLPCHRVKMDIPKPRGILPLHGSDFRSRSPLSIRALHSTRNERVGQASTFVRKPIADFPVRAALSRAWSRMTGVGNSLKLRMHEFRNWMTSSTPSFLYSNNSPFIKCGCQWRTINMCISCE